MKKKITKIAEKNNTYFLSYIDKSETLCSITIDAPNFNKMLKIFEEENNFAHDLEILSVWRITT